MIIAYPGGFMPLSASRYQETELFRAKFHKEDCASCPLKDRCIIKKQKRMNEANYHQRLSFPYADILTETVELTLLNNEGQ